MDQPAHGNEFMQTLLVERVLLIFQTVGVPLTGIRRERVESLSADYLYRLLDVVDKLESDDRVGQLKAVDDAIQTCWQDQAIAVIRAKGGRWPAPKLAELTAGQMRTGQDDGRDRRPETQPRELSRVQFFRQGGDRKEAGQG